MGLASPEREPQRLALPEQVRLAYQLIERVWAQPIGERGIRRALLEEIIH
jgi:hypothetical protein